MQACKCILIQILSPSINPTQSTDTLHDVDPRNKAVTHHPSAASPHSSDTLSLLYSLEASPTASTPVSPHPAPHQQPDHYAVLPISPSYPLSWAITPPARQPSQPSVQYIPPGKETLLQTPDAAGKLESSVTTAHFYELNTAHLHCMIINLFLFCMRYFLTSLWMFPKQILLCFQTKIVFSSPIPLNIQMPFPYIRSTFFIISIYVLVWKLLQT